MLLRRTTECPRVAISQPAHAFLAGTLAAAWGNAVFQVPVPRDQVICATALHDIGWLAWERAPILDQSTGFPLEFQYVPAETHTKLWQQGIEHAEAYGVMPALLVSRHGDAIYERTFDIVTARPEAATAVAAFRVGQLAFQNEMLRRLAVDPSLADAATDRNLAFAKAFIVAVDTMSLNLCWGLKGEVMIADVPVSEDRGETISMKTGSGDIVEIHPWPFQHPTVRASIEGKLLDRSCRTQAELDELVAHAPPVLLHFHLAGR